MKNLFLIIFLFVSVSVSGQEISIISSDRPDQSESPEVVSKNHTQFEVGFGYDKSQYTRVFPLGENGTVEYTSITELTSTPEVLVRMGVFKDVEFRLSTVLATTKWSNRPEGIFDTPAETRFGPIGIGAKLKLSDEKGFIPSIGMLVENSMPGLTQKGGSIFNPSIRFCFSNELTNKISLSYNLGVDLVSDESSVATGLYTFAAEYSLSALAGVFGEVYGFIPFNDQISSSHYVDGGFTFLMNKNLQFDISGGYGLQKQITEFFIAAGAAFRFAN